MKSLVLLGISLLGPLFGEEGTGPLHLYAPGQALTEGSTLAARDIGRAFLLESHRGSDLGIEQAGLGGAHPDKEYRTAHNGVTHLVYRQRFQGIDVDNAEWVINIDRDGRVLNAGGRLAEAPDSKSRIPSPELALKAVRTAVGVVDQKAAERFQPFQEVAATGRAMTFHGASTGGDIPGHAPCRSRQSGACVAVPGNRSRWHPHARRDHRWRRPPRDDEAFVDVTAECRQAAGSGV